MLGPGRYLLGAAELIWLVGFAWLGASRVRRRLLPEVGGEAGFLAGAVVALALLIWMAELLGTVSAFKPVPYLVAVALVGLVLRRSVPPAGGAPMGAPRRAQAAPAPSAVGEIDVAGPAAENPGPSGPSPSGPPPNRPSLIATVISLLIAGIAIGHFVSGVKLRLGTGMTGFDSTWYHGPFAAGFFQTGNTIDLHFIAPQFLAWFYPANSEVVHAIGMLAFSRDLMSPLLNLGWLVGCLLACWCIGRPFRVAPWSLALGAIALSVPALADQAGEARNDIVGIFFALAAVAIALNAAAASPGGVRRPGRQAVGSANSPAGSEAPPAGLSTGALLCVGLAIGLAAGTKLNFLLPAAVLVIGLTALVPGGRRWRSLLCCGGMALAGGGYWYLRNLIHSGNPLPWIHHLGPIDLPAPEQALGGREAHSVFSYLTDGSVWSDWFLPGLHGGLWSIWPVLGAAALAGLLLALVPWVRGRWAEERSYSAVFGPSTRGVLALAGLVGLAAAVSWLLSPTSASGPDGMPRGFESGIRYLAPALILGLALLPTVPPLRAWAARLAAIGPKLGERPVPDDERPQLPHVGGGECGRPDRQDRLPRGWVAGIVAGAVLVAIVVGYPVARHYLRDRYRDPSFTTPGLDAAFAWARDIDGARIATTSTRLYPLFGTDLSNRVAYLGVHRPHGGFEEAPNCRVFRRLVNEGDYDYVVATRDRIEPGKPAFAPQAKWIEGPDAEVVLKKRPTVVFRITGTLDPNACP
ncbi:MAG TPA: hypothetical protein VMF55_04125 [Solirubrobacterales bacterium]|nr:hypothetical protein [Solirubrobacterales bacterium]